MAMALIEENKKMIGEKVVDQAIEKIKKDSKKQTKEKGGEEDGKKTKTTRRKSTKSV